MSVCRLEFHFMTKIHFNFLHTLEIFFRKIHGVNSFPLISDTIRREIIAESWKNMETLIRKNFHYNCLSLTHSLFLFLPPFYMMKFSSLSGGLFCAGVFRFVSCKSSSSLNTKTLNFAMRWKNCFSDQNHFPLFLHSLSLTPSLFLYYWRLMIT